MATTFKVFLYCNIAQRIKLLMDVLGLNQAYNRAIRRERVFRDRNNPPYCYDDTELCERYQFTRNGIMFLLDNLQGLEPTTRRSYAVPKSLKIFIGLRFLATGAFQSLVGDELGIQLSQPTISRSLTQFLQSVSTFAPTCIQWPADTKATEKHFFEHFRIPNVVGCIDGTHVQIIAPSGEEEPAYVNRLNYHSINVQAVCDHSARFISVNAKKPGSVHDSTVLRVNIKTIKLNALFTINEYYENF